MPAAAPPRTDRLLFWVFGRRVAPQHRPWAAEQLQDPSYQRRRHRGAVLLLVVCVILPQGLLAYAGHSWSRAVFPAVVAGTMVAGVRAARRPLTATQRERLLAYHGVTADGRLREPVRVRAANPLGRAGLALLMAQVLLVGAGAAVAIDRLTAPDRCRPVSAADLRALRAVIGVPSPGGGHVAPLLSGPAVQLSRPGRVDTVFRGMHYVAAYVSGGARGPVFGPAVWRITEPDATVDRETRDIAAADLLASELAPNVGTMVSTADEPLLDKARSCATHASP